MSKDPYTIRYTGREKTEDGDVCFFYEVLANGFAGVRAYNEDQRNRRGAHGGAGDTILEWKGIGNGVLFARYTKVVDGTEVAIEAMNDAWACEQEQADIAGARLMGFLV